MKIFVNGYWNNNLGDDLFLKTLLERYNNHIFYIIANKSYRLKFNKYRNLRVINYNFINKVSDKLSSIFNRSIFFSNGRKILNNLSGKDAYCELGGSLFMLPKQGMDLNYSVRNKVCREKIPYFIIGSNFGPYFNQVQLDKYGGFFGKSYGTVFRDKKSYRLFPNDNVDYAPDVVFNLKVEKYLKNSKKDYILISVINPSKKLNDLEKENKYLNYLKFVIGDYLSRGEKIVLMSFCKSEGDLQFANHLKNMFDSNNISVYDYKNIDSALFVINNAKKIIATRYHAMILAWKLNKPVFVISYSEKTNNVIKYCFPKQHFINIRDINSRSSYKMPLFSINNDVRNLSLLADQQFKYLDNFLR